MEAVERNSCVEREPCWKMIWSKCLQLAESWSNATLCPAFSRTASAIFLPAMNIHPFPNGFKNKPSLQDLLYLLFLFLSPPKIIAHQEPPSSPKSTLFIQVTPLHLPPSQTRLLYRFFPHLALWKEGRGDRKVLGLVTSQRSLANVTYRRSRTSSSCTSTISCCTSIFLRPMMSPVWEQFNFSKRKKGNQKTQTGRKKSHLETSNTSREFFTPGKFEHDSSPGSGSIKRSFRWPIQVIKVYTYAAKILQYREKLHLHFMDNTLFDK